MSSLVLDQDFDNEIHVLLVDHDKESLISMAEMLKSCSYQVTKVKLASTAVAMLLNGAKFDVVMANAHSPDMQAFKLLQEAVKLEIVVILTTDKREVLFTTRAIENGAFLVLNKPVSMESMSYLWQFVIWERQKRENNGQDGLSMSTIMNEQWLGQVKEEVSEVDDGLDLNRMDNQIKRKSKVKTGAKPSTEDAESTITDDDNAKGKVSIKWTSELHAKFVDAVNELGEGKCYPSDILGLMNEPGLTRMQVASHLQKCRSGVWKDPAKQTIHPPAPPLKGDGSQKKTFKRFGTMPPGADTSSGSGSQSSSEMTKWL